MGLVGRFTFLLFREGRFWLTLDILTLIAASFGPGAVFRLFFEGGAGAWCGAVCKKWVRAAAKKCRPSMVEAPIFSTTRIRPNCG